MPDTDRFSHQPVLLAEVLEQLRPRPGGIYVDCTLGGGGHSAAILQASAPDGLLVGLDQDGDALAAAARRLAPWVERVRLRRANFLQLAEVLAELGLERVDGVLFDLGVSSYQLDTPERGFSYWHDAPLDMRMDRRSALTAAEIVNTWPVEELVAVISRYGEDRFARRIAVAIERERRREPIATTGRLAEIIREAIPASQRRQGGHPARRTFQALRIAVNRELDVIAPALEQAVQHLEPGGRLLVITFHSLEDRIVKNTLRRMAHPCRCPADFPRCVCGQKPLVKLPVPGGIAPAARELAENPRSRSARLRVAEKMPDWF
ncbi:MAG: 16S rRNA (cytosine(1402)-N(4))-methyltransferase RsmH [Desulfurispora sp.]|uniref:16S rRNA (cytosine(1402)-N(4))-methyltransferase RsmH n=1 Tax=Desulfurispora sp. TaxID=3014275 RepID=UPI0040490907